MGAAAATVAAVTVAFSAALPWADGPAPRVGEDSSGSPPMAGKPNQNAAAKTVARHVLYTGRVQGVGFRARCQDLARPHKVTGWVKNLDDGRVELHAEGPADAVAAFLADVRRTFKSNITDEAVNDAPPMGTFRSFTIEY
jgi:acylphosphatase